MTMIPCVVRNLTLLSEENDNFIDVKPKLRQFINCSLIFVA